MAGHLTFQERDRIAQLRHRGADQKETAKAPNRSPAAISRELRRNGAGRECYAGQAQQQAGKRRRERPLLRKMDDPETNRFVRRGLAQERAPQQIAGRLKKSRPPRAVSAQTIYNWIKRDEQRDHWQACLRRRGKRPGRRKNKAATGDAARIANRPEVVEERLRLGDLEGDTVLGPAGTGGPATLVDRKSRYTIVVKIRCKEADHVHQKIKQRLKELDEEHRRTITFDNGTEFARCHRLQKHLGMALYRADPGCPYQRGANEHTNGLIRQYFPKGTDFRGVSHHEVRQVETRLNNRPRACLGFQSPAEVFFEKQPLADCD
jgi:IS30 family transposase